MSEKFVYFFGRGAAEGNKDMKDLLGGKGANLAEMAGSVSVTVNAHSEEGFDKNKLRNGVIEPLQEADLIE